MSDTQHAARTPARGGLLAGAALVLLAGIVALMLWQAGGSGASPVDRPEGAETTEPLAHPDSGSRAGTAMVPRVEVEARSPLEAEPTATDEGGAQAALDPQPEEVLLRGRVFGPDGVVLADAALSLHAEPVLVPGSTPGAAAERWRRHAPRAPAEPGLRPDGILNPPYPSGHRLPLRTDEGGRFEVRLPPEARELGVRLTFQKGGWRAGATAELELKDLSRTDAAGEDLGDIRLVAGEHRLIVAGRVLGPGGQPVPGAEVRVMGARMFELDGVMRVGTGDLLRVHTDGRGAFEALGKLLDGEATEGLRLYASAEGFANGRSGAVKLGASDATIFLGRAARFSGRVEAGLDEPLPAGLDAVLRWQTTPGVSPFTRNPSGLRVPVQPDGSFAFDSITPRRYALRFELRRRALPDPDLVFLDLELLDGETLIDPRFQPIDLSAHLWIYRLWVESVRGVELEAVRVASGRIPEGGQVPLVALNEVGNFEQRASWLDLSPPLRIEVSEASHAPGILDLFSRQGEVTVRLENAAVLRVRLAGGLPPVEAGKQLSVRLFPFGHSVHLDSDGTASLPIDPHTHQLLLTGHGYELQMMLEGSSPPSLKRLEPRIGPKELGPARGTLEWTIELTGELLSAIAGKD